MKSIFNVLPKAETWVLSVQTCAHSGTHCNPKLHWILFIGEIRLYESQAMVGLYSLSLFFPPSCYIYSIYLVRTAEFCYLITFWLLKFAQAVNLLIFHCIISYNQSRDLFFNIENVGQRLHFWCIWFICIMKWLLKPSWHFHGAADWFRIWFAFFKANRVLLSVLCSVYWV